MSASSEQRQKIYVNRAIQGRLISRVCLYWFAYHVALWHVMFAFYYWRQSSGVMPGQPQVAFFAHYGLFAIENSSLAVCALAVAPLVLWDALQMTHRVVGPLVRFQAVLEQLARGEKVDQVTLRDGDLLTELRDGFNNYLAASRQLAQRGDAERRVDVLDSSRLVEISHAMSDDDALPARSRMLNA